MLQHSDAQPKHFRNVFVRGNLLSRRAILLDHTDEKPLHA
jgi:hypothetical protein